MKYLKIILILLMPMAFSNCSKSSSNGNMSPAPTDLTVSAAISTDNSGNVTFTATATNAVSYDYDFGNGTFQTVPTGIITYKYPSSGTYTVNVIAKSSGGQTIAKTVQVTVVSNGGPAGMTLVWSDEFNTDGAPDPSKWGYDTGTGGGGWGNNELEYYTSRSNNVNVSNGTLKITAVKENYNGSAYTSARMLSNGKFSFKYGRIEVSAKLPAGLGTWPAIWMLGNNFSTAGWPNCGEIDIMEQRGSELNKIFGTLHYPGHSGANGRGSTTIIQNSSAQFHLYALDWSAASINFSIDGNVFFTVPNDNTLPFNQNFFVILNLAMGGSFGGSVDPNFTSGTMEVDYVRVYQ
ncbi:family 16 glycosylhydrolase [uncultured Mucilaginibacter sp.]|uniref:family 16 glycosylhydrolase n=1 Tax=uncultured Mucilaginibacter sp. TaxID=797541 RepID=UPI0025DC25B8|nr:family 16 glycosylhydrolase [uncultured Mucilaginibacter sp.]